jgi:hypothetical protein
VNLGAVLIWVSWFYITAAILVAKLAYRRVQKADPTYFEASDGVGADLFSLKKTRGIFELITDDSLQLNGFEPSLIKMVWLVKIMFFTAPIAFLLFLFGIFVR